MITIVVTEEDLTTLRYGRFQQPDQRVHVRMEALYLYSQGVTKGEILRLCGMPNASFQRDLKADVRGGVERVCLHSVSHPEA